MRRPLSASRRADYGSLPPTKARHADDLRRASLGSRLLFTYAEPLMAEGAQRQLSADELWSLERENEAPAAYAAFLRALGAGRRAGVARALAVAYGPRVALCGLGSLLSAAGALFAPLVLHRVVAALSAPEGQLDARGLAQWLAALFAAKLLGAVVSTQAQFQTEMVALRLTVALKALLFDKLLRCAAAPAPGADLVNLYTTDVTNVLWAAFQFNSLWVLPLQIAAAVYLLYAVLGAAAFAGLAVIALSIAASLALALRSGRAFARIMERKDARVRAMKEVFGAIQVVKMSAWEPRFARRVAALRATELRAVATYLRLGAASSSLLWGSPLLVSLASFAVYALALGRPLSAAQVFTAMALFNAVRDPLQTLPSVIQQCVQARVSLARVQEFLARDEIDAAAVARDDPARPAHVSVAVDAGAFAWTRPRSPTDAAAAVLAGVDLEVRRGDLVVVDGPVGAGKSTLCAALLGDAHRLAGRVLVRGRVAYCPQQPWIQNASLRDNVLFGAPLDRERYARVLDACCLLPDLRQLPGGDLAEIGPKGVNLSGGQKARVALARACYADADVLVLDSPLAAVDAHVRADIFRRCVCGLLRDKTVLLVTHAPDVIASAAVSCRVTVADGRVTVERREPAAPTSLQSSPPPPPPPPPSQALSPSPSHAQAQEDERARRDAQARDDGKLVEEEDRFEGRVSAAVFARYLSAMGGWPMCVFVVAVQLLWQAFQVGSDLWLSHWTGRSAEAVAAEIKSEAEPPLDRRATTFYLGVYGALGAASAAMVVLRSFAVPHAGLRASRELFRAMTDALLAAPLAFFDANPIGRVMNRLGDDMASVDFGLPVAYSGMLASLFMTATQLATAVYMVDLLGVLVLPLLYLYVRVASFYLVPSREASRLWKVSSSPVLSFVAEAEQGVAVLRAFGPDHLARAVAGNLARIDAVSRVWLVFTVTAQWFQLRMQLLGCGVVVVVVSALIYLRGVLSPGLVGLAFTYALSVDAGLAVLVRWWSWVEIAMVSPERILEYAAIPPEGQASALATEPDAQWPQHGALAFEGVVFRYTRGGPDVLRGVSFAVKGGEKIGIVGRTGAGKSSLTMALFRINELAGGRVVIDGLDVAAVPLRALRSRLSIIPQAPVLFRGTLRAFMDPFDDFSDAQLWAALVKVDMRARVARLELGLSHELAENGDNFSVGERQLLCMARALLTRARVVVMDEATASVDRETERRLQRMAERELAGATVLTIAHRLATVMRADRILVLRDGQVAEFDTPQRLLADRAGVFHALAAEDEGRGSPARDTDDNDRGGRE